MSVPLTGVGGFFVRHGAFIGEYNRVAAFYGSGLDAGFQTIWSQFASSDQAAVQALPAAVTQFKSTGSSYGQSLISAGQLAILLQVSDDVSVVPYTIQQALGVILRNQMISAGQSINRPTLTSLVSAATGNLGDASVVVSTTNIFGDPLDMTLSEIFTVKCTTGGSPFNGSLQAVGVASVPVSSPLWPGGSGASVSFSIVDPAGSGNLLTDGGIYSWGGTGNNTPLQWDIVNGDAGITVFKSAGGGYRTGTDAAQITSDGAEATQLAQTITPTINTVYAVCVFVKINANSATGAFRIAITDGNGTVLNNDAGTPLSSTVALTGAGGAVTTSYQMFTAFFSMPRQLPTTTRLFIGTSVAAIATRVVTFGLVGMVQATPLYGLQSTGTAGPFIAAFAGKTATAILDKYTVTFTNNLTTQSFVLGMERLYGLRGMGVYLPSAVSETIPDSLVTH